MSKTPGKRPFHGWRVLMALFIVGATGPMARYSITAFFPAISSELQWSHSQIGLSQSISLWAYSFFSLFTGWMVDRLGSRKTIFMGGLWCLAGWLLLSTVTSLRQLYFYYGIIMAMAMASTHLVPTQATARKWFIKRAGIAGGIIGSAFAVGNAIFVPFITSMSSAYGWRSVSIGCAFIFSIPILLLAFFLIRNTPESVGQLPDGAKFPLKIKGSPESIEINWSVRDALKTPQLWLLFVSYGVTGIVINALQAHLVIWGVELGSTAAVAGVLVTLFNGPSIVARIGGGWLADKFGKSKILVLGAALSLLVILLAWFGINTENELFIFAPILGIGTSLSNTLFAPYIGDLFGRINVGSLFAILTLGWGLVGGFGPIIWGIIFDNTGSYGGALLISAVCCAIALAAQLLIRPPRLKQVKK
ncbi:MAG: MFS transporter [Deltaproteobacteria bacterium]|nr:MFS transporter [Deltaproteobacteria bacterium]